MFLHIYGIAQWHTWNIWEAVPASSLHEPKHILLDYPHIYHLVYGMNLAASNSIKHPPPLQLGAFRSGSKVSRLEETYLTGLISSSNHGTTGIIFETVFCNLLEWWCSWAWRVVCFLFVVGKSQSLSSRHFVAAMLSHHYLRSMVQYNMLFVFICVAFLFSIHDPTFVILVQTCHCLQALVLGRLWLLKPYKIPGVACWNLPQYCFMKPTCGRERPSMLIGCCFLTIFSAMQYLESNSLHSITLLKLVVL